MQCFTSFTTISTAQLFFFLRCLYCTYCEQITPIKMGDNRARFFAHDVKGKLSFLREGTGSSSKMVNHTHGSSAFFCYFRSFILCNKLSTVKGITKVIREVGNKPGKLWCCNVMRSAKQKPLQLTSPFCNEAWDCEQQWYLTWLFVC